MKLEPDLVPDSDGEWVDLEDAEAVESELQVPEEFIPPELCQPKPKDIETWVDESGMIHVDDAP